MRIFRLKRQRGVAVVTALLLTTLAITIVTSLYEQQQVQVRSIENQRTQQNKEWILRGALDWAMLIIATDNPQIDSLDDAWAVPLQPTRLNDFLEKGGDDPEAGDPTLWGDVTDAQSLFNLANLLQDSGDIDPAQLAVFSRLLGFLKMDSHLAQSTAELMQESARTQPGSLPPGNVQPGAQPSSQLGGTDSSSGQFLKISQVDDLLAVKGFTPQQVDTLKKFVVVLPQRNTKININTASAEVIAASIDKLSLSDAMALVAERKRAYFRDLANLGTALAKYNVTDPSVVQLNTTYFLINGHVRINNASMNMQALVGRNTGRAPQVMWMRQL